LSTDSTGENDNWLGGLRPREAERLFRSMPPDGKQALAGNAEIVDDRLLDAMLREPTVWPMVAANVHLPKKLRPLVADTLLSAFELRRGELPTVLRLKAAARGLRALVQANYDFTAPQQTRIRRMLTKGNALAAGHAALELHDVMPPDCEDMVEAAMSRAISSKRVGRCMAKEYLDRPDLPASIVELIARQWGGDRDIAESVLRHPSATIASWASVLSTRVDPWRTTSVWSEVVRLACASSDPRRLVWTLENVPQKFLPGIVPAQSLVRWAASVPVTEAERALAVLARRAAIVVVQLAKAGGIPPGVYLEPDDLVGVFQADGTQEDAIAALRTLMRPGTAPSASAPPDDRR
jgi:hypothetical protein